MITKIIITKILYDYQKIITKNIIIFYINDDFYKYNNLIYTNICHQKQL